MVKYYSTFCLSLVLGFSFSAYAQQWLGVNGTLGLAPNKVSFFSANDSMLVASTSGLFKASPDGSNWFRPTSDPLALQEVNDLLVDGSKIFMVGTNSEVYISADFGLTWASMYTIPISGYSNPRLARSNDTTYLAFNDPAGTAYLFMDDGLGSGFLYQSDFQSAGRISMLSIQGGKLFVGMDGGLGLWVKDATGGWSNYTVGLINAPNEIVLSILFDVSSGKVFCGTSRDLYQCNSSNFNWSSIGIASGLSERKYNDLVRIGNKLYVGTDDGFGIVDLTNLGLSSSSLGLSTVNFEVKDMQASGNKLVIGLDRYGIVKLTSPSDVSTLYTAIPGNSIYSVGAAGNFPYVGSYPAGTLIDYTQSNTWTKVEYPVFRHKTKAVIASNSYLFAASTAGVYRFLETGSTWEEANGNLALSSNLDPNFPVSDLVEWQGLLIAAIDGRGLYKTMDNGDNWFQYFQSPISSVDNCLDFCRKSSDTLLLSTANSIYFQTSLDPTVWTPIPQFSSGLGAEKMMFVGDTLWVLRNTEVYLSADFGQNWSVAVPSNPGGWTDFALVQETGRNVVVLTGAVGILATANGGQNWTNITANLTNVARATAVGVANSFLYIGTKWNGLFKRSLGTAMPILSFENVVVTNNCPGIGAGSIKIAVVSGGTPPYSYSLDNGTLQTDNLFSDLAPGTYLIKLIDANGNFIETSVTVQTGTSFTVTAVDYTNDICDGNLITLDPVVVVPVGNYTYQWTDPNGGVSSFNGNDQQLGPTVQADFDAFTITVTDEFGCAHSDVADINRHVGQEISGKVTINGSDIDFASLGIDSIEVKLLYLESANDGYYEPVESFFIVPSQNGAPPYQYKFQHVPTGFYKIFAKVSDSNAPSNLLPTYLGNTMYWGAADLLSFPTSNCNLENQDIDMIQSAIGTGTGIINGYIHFGEFKTENSQAGDPIPLIDVVVEKDSIFFCTQAHEVFTNYYFYQFNNLPLQCYDFIYVNVPGVVTLNNYNPCLTAENPIVTYRNFCADTIGTILGTTQLDTCPIDTSLLVSMQTLEETESRVYPNPCSGEVYIQNVDNLMDVQVFDMQGKRVEVKWDKPMQKVGLEQRDGLYTLVLKFNGKMEVHRLVLRQ